MTHLNVTPDAEGRWTDIEDRITGRGQITHVGLLRNATSGGRAMFTVAVTLPDGSVVLAGTTWRAMKNAFVFITASPLVAEET